MSEFPLAWGDQQRENKTKGVLAHSARLFFLGGGGREGTSAWGGHRGVALQDTKSKGLWKFYQGDREGAPPVYCQCIQPGHWTQNRIRSKYVGCNMPHWLACPIDTCQCGMGQPVCPIDTCHWGMGQPVCPTDRCQWGMGQQARAPLTHVIWNTCQWGTLHWSFYNVPQCQISANASRWSPAGGLPVPCWRTVALTC